jgi:hypothetical protein
VGGGGMQEEEEAVEKGRETERSGDWQGKKI